MARFEDVAGLRLAISTNGPSLFLTTAARIRRLPAFEPAHFKEALVIGLLSAFLSLIGSAVPIAADITHALGFPNNPYSYLGTDLHGASWLSLAEPLPALFYGLALFGLLYRSGLNSTWSFFASILSSYTAWWMGSEAAYFCFRHFFGEHQDMIAGAVAGTLAAAITYTSAIIIFPQVRDSRYVLAGVLLGGISGGTTLSSGSDLGWVLPFLPWQTATLILIAKAADPPEDRRAGAQSLLPNFLKRHRQWALTILLLGIVCPFITYQYFQIDPLWEAVGTSTLVAKGPFTAPIFDSKKVDAIELFVRTTKTPILLCGRISSKHHHGDEGSRSGLLSVMLQLQLFKRLDKDEPRRAGQITLAKLIRIGDPIVTDYPLSIGHEPVTQFVEIRTGQGKRCAVSDLYGLYVRRHQP